jgi:hypothetical protein
MQDSTLCLDCELHIVAISTMDNPDPLDLLGRKCCNLLLGIADQPQASNATPIGEGDVLAIGFQLPARLLVLDAPVIVLEPGIAFLAWLVGLAVVIEAGDGKPCSISTGLTSLGIETSSKGICFSEYSTIALQVILGDATLVHPQAQAFIADELYYSDSVLDSSILLLGTI